MIADKKYPSVAVVILSWNGKHFLEQFLPSVTSTSYSGAEIYIADNASTDDSIAFVRKKYPEVKVIALEKNEGFATGYNKALQQVQADYYVLLNQDVEVEKDWIQPVIDAMEADHSIAACQPKIRSFHNKKYFEYAGAAGGFIDKFGYPFCRGRIFDVLEEDKGQYDESSEIFWATGAAMFVRTEIYHQLGGLDDDFFAHMEEIDLCWRIKNAGYKIKYVPQSVVYHVGGGSLPQGNPQKTYLNFRNNLIMMIKNLPQKQVTWRIRQRLLLDHIAAYKSLFSGNAADFRAIARAHREIIFSYGKWKAKRKDVQDRVKKVKLGPPNLKGMYNRSIVRDYFFRKKRYFSDLNAGDFL